MNKWTPFFKWQKQSKTAYLHKAIHYSNVKTIYNITIKKSKQAAAQRYSKKTCKLRACRPAAATLLKMNSLLSFISIFQRFRLLFRSTQLKEHLCMVTSENITQIKAKIKKNACFPVFLYRIVLMTFLIFSILSMKKCCDCFWKIKKHSQSTFSHFHKKR